jgi:biotin carboxyl carrier protein
MNFTDKNIWITGASSGIGKALAVELSQYKPNLILSSRNNDELLKTKEICEQNGAKCFIQLLDLSKVNEIKAPMPGLVLDIIAEVGQEVNEGDNILILEAMKMENNIKSPTTGVIKEIKCEKGAAVEKNEVLILFE